MFTKVDYETYFLAIQKADKKMLEGLSNIIDQVSDDTVSKILTHIKDDEERHVLLGDELLGLLQKEAVGSAAQGD
jgi:rubrerythrin